MDIVCRDKAGGRSWWGGYASGAFFGVAAVAEGFGTQAGFFLVRLTVSKGEWSGRGRSRSRLLSSWLLLGWEAIEGARKLSLFGTAGS
jgi:hypothetical protein